MGDFLGFNSDEQQIMITDNGVKQPLTTSTLSKKRNSSPFILLGLLMAAVLVGGYFLSLRQSSAPQPQVALKNADPEVARVVRAAQDEVSAAPQSATTWGKLGMLLYIHSFPEQAQQCFAQAQKLDPRDPRWPYLSGVCLLIKNPVTAIPDLKKAEALTGSAPDAPRMVLAEALLNQGHNEDAKPYIDAALKSDPNNPRALLALGRYDLAKGQLIPSRDALIHSYQNAPNVKSTQLLLSQVFQQQRDTQKAAIFANQAAKLPDQPTWRDPYLDVINQMQVGQGVQIQRGEIYVINGQFAAAQAQMQQTVKQYPKSGRAWMLLGTANVGLNNLKEAESELRKSIVLDPKSAESLNHLGDALARQGKNKEAVSFFEKAISLSSQSAEFHFNLGVCLLRTKNALGAIKEFKTVVGIAPDAVKGHAALSEALASQGQYATARQELQTALKLSPNDPILLKGLAQLKNKEQ